MEPAVYCQYMSRSEMDRFLANDCIREGRPEYLFRSIGIDLGGEEVDASISFRDISNDDTPEGADRLSVTVSVPKGRSVIPSLNEVLNPFGFYCINSRA